LFRIDDDLLTEDERSEFPIYFPNAGKTYREAKIFADRLYSFGLVGKIFRKKRHKHKVYYLVLELYE